jgi:SAM-dependent methyltransferase
MITCIVCSGSNVEQFLDLGSTALANRFLSAAELSAPEPRNPLRVGFCNDCGHVQLLDRVPPAEMFTDYLYVSSASTTLKEHLFDLSDIVVERYRPGQDDLVIDIGCNDGTLLSGFQRHGVRVLGVDPAENLADLTAESGIDRYVGFFNSDTAKVIADRWGKASVVTATNTFPHIPDLPDFVEGVRTVLAPEGVLVLEMHYLIDLLEQGAFDTVYHEHVSYWALGPAKRLFEGLDMEVTNAERLPLHHGQLRLFVQRKSQGEVSPAVVELLQEEGSKGVGDFGTYERFADKAQQIKRDLRRLLSDLVAQGKKVVGYGAPAKANTLLGFLGIGRETLEYIADVSPLKQGRYTPDTHIPVVPPERLLESQPDYVLLLAWNFADEIMEQQTEYRRRGGRFIVPVPEVKIV